MLLRIALSLVLLAALAMALAPQLANLFSPQRKLTTSGDPADIQLVGVAPDGDDVLYNGRGEILGEKFDWPGKRTYTWPPGTMLREFLFELGPGLEDLDFNQNDPGTVRPVEKRSWIQQVTCTLEDERVLGPSGHRRVLFRVAVHTNYLRRVALFGGRQALVEIDLELHFLGKARGPAALSFDGPFVLGKTNVAQESKPFWLVALTNSLWQNSEGTPFELRWTGYGGGWSQIFAHDLEGKRHQAYLESSSTTPNGSTNRFVVRGVALKGIAAITFGEEPRVKIFHNVVIKYPDRPPRTHTPARDRLASTLGKTNMAVASLEHYNPNSTREAMEVLEHLPGHRNAVSALANASGSTNFSELTPAQREKLRALAGAWARGPEGYERDIGLRLGLRGAWPEFLELALGRLTNGSNPDCLHAANALAWTQAKAGAEHVPLLSALARTNALGDVSASLIRVLQRAGPSGSNTLFELAQADAPWLWWGAIASLPPRALEPVAALSHEMQQRLWLVSERTNLPVSLAARSAAQARLPELLTPELQRRNPYVFSSACRRLQRIDDKPAAMAALTKFLRDVPPEQAKYQPPTELVRQINAWYGKDFGGLGLPSGNSSRSPSPGEWPEIVEEVLQFCEKLEGAGQAAAEK